MSGDRVGELAPREVGTAPLPTSPVRLARTAGGLYLLLVILGAFAHLHVRAAVHVPGDAAATAENVVANAALFRLGFVADLLMATCFLLVALTLHLLLRHVDADVARAMVVFVLIAVAIICLNLLHHLAALLVAGDGSYGAALGPAGSDALVLLLLDMHRHGYLIAQLFFGLWLLPLGYLVHRSGLFPRLLGSLLVIGCLSHLADMFALFLVPTLPEALSALVRAPVTVAELWLVGYLLVRGVRTPRSSRPSPDPA